MTEVHQFVTLLPAKPMEVKASNLDPDQYWVEGKSEGYGWRDTNVSFSGYFGSYGPHIFAAAPDALEFAHWVSDATDEELIRLARKKSRVVIAKAEART